MKRVFLFYWALSMLLFLLPLDAQVTGPLNQQPKLIRVQLRLNGLYPAALTVEEGKYEIYLENAVFRSQVNFQLDDEAGRLVGQTNVIDGKFRGRQRLVVDLRPGKHRLRVVDQPNWKTELTVTPKR